MAIRNPVEIRLEATLKWGISAREVLKNFAEADRVRQIVERSQWHRRRKTSTQQNAPKGSLNP
jgi:hypothetical protein